MNITIYVKPNEYYQLGSPRLKSFHTCIITLNNAPQKYFALIYYVCYTIILTSKVQGIRANPEGTVAVEHDCLRVHLL